MALKFTLQSLWPKVLFCVQEATDFFAMVLLVATY